MSAAEWLVSDAVTEALAKIKAENQSEPDFLIFECHEHGDFRVLVELVGDHWMVTEEDGERCPVCGQFGRDLEGEDPDAFWGASERKEGEEEEEEWLEPSLTDAERQR